MKTLVWKSYSADNMDEALSCNYCVYVLHNPLDNDRPHYIGKAKYFGTKQSDGYKGSARYNSGYTHLLAGMLRAGYTLYIAEIGETDYTNAEAYEQELIHIWNPIRDQKRKPKIRMKVQQEKPWGNII